MTETKVTEEPNLIMGMVLKVPGKDAVVSSWAWYRAPSTTDNKPPREAMEGAFKRWLDEWYKYPLADHQDGSVKNVGDLIGELFCVLPALPGGTGHKVAFESNGEHFPIDTVDYDEFLKSSDPEYVDEGTDMVLLAGPKD